MKILALGGTGVIGCQLISQLSSEGHECYTTSRQTRPSDGVVNYLRGNALDETFMHEILRKHWDVVIDFMVYNTCHFKNRIQAYLTSANHYIFTSSARVFADSDTPITERSPRLLDVLSDPFYLATDEYALAKARQEDLLKNSNHSNWTIVRPYITFGEGRLQLGPLEVAEWLNRPLNDKSIVFCDELMNKWTTLTDAADVARMISALLCIPAAMREDYNLVGPSSVTWSNVLDLYLDELEFYNGKRPRVKLLTIDNFCSVSSSIPKIKYDRIYNRKFDTFKIRKYFDFNDLDYCLDALRSHFRRQLICGDVVQVDWRAEALTDRAVQEYANLLKIPDMRSRLRYLYYRHAPSRVLRKAEAQ